MSHKRVLILGDIHGCLGELDDLLKKLSFKKDQDHLISVGDLVDRGPDSVGVIRRMRELGATTVVGNHETKVMRALQETFALNKHSTRMQGILKHLRSDDIQYLRRMPNSYRVGPRIVIAHAGAEPATPFDKQDQETLTRVRHVSKDGFFTKGSSWSHSDKDGYYWAYGWKGPECIIYGHQVHNLTQPLSVFSKSEGTTGWTLGIDTGCCYGGRLTAAVLDPMDIFGENLEIVQVDARETYTTMYMPPDIEKPSESRKKEPRQLSLAQWN